MAAYTYFIVLYMVSVTSSLYTHYYNAVSFRNYSSLLSRQGCWDRRPQRNPLRKEPQADETRESQKRSRHHQ